MVKKYRVELTEGERGELKALVSQGRAAAYKQTHARILLLSDENWGEGPLKDLEIARVLQVGTATVERVRRRCVEAGVEAALSRRQQLKRRPKKLDGSGEAHPVSSTGQALIALACSTPPEGRVSWTLQLLADGLVEREIVERISPDTVGRTLKKTSLSPRSATGQALAEGMLVYSAPGQRSVRVRHGGRAGGLSSGLGGTGGAGVPGRDQQATGGGDPPTPATQTRFSPDLRLCVPA